MGIFCLLAAAAVAYLWCFPRRGKVDMELKMGDETKEAVYEGELGFFSGKPKGRGKMTIVEGGSILEGYWDNANFKGPGKFTIFADDKTVFMTTEFSPGASLINGKFDGEITTHLGNEHFSFNYVGGKRDGLAKYTFENGDVFEIHWAKDQCDEKAKFIKKSGETYEGDWYPQTKDAAYGGLLGHIKTYHKDGSPIDVIPVKEKGSHFSTVHYHK